MGKYIFICALLAGLFFSGCEKKNFCLPSDEKSRLGYGESIFYLAKDDYTVRPLARRAGIYNAFPNNLTIDNNTGAITVTQKGKDGESQTGLWYKITYRSAANEVDSTMILLSGISYLDKFYSLPQNDSIIYPIYNGDPANALPQGNYDLRSDDKFAVNPLNGQINIKECMRRGFFGNASWREATVKYAIKDKSNEEENRIDLVIYYYRNMSAVPSNVSALMQAHQQQTVGLRSLPVIPATNGAVDNNLPGNLSRAKPRPPCVIIIGN